MHGNFENFQILIYKSEMNQIFIFALINLARIKSVVDRYRVT
jgi:hypothetical protein